MKRVKVCFSTFIVVLAVVLGNLPVSGEQVTAKGFETPEYYGKSVLAGLDNSATYLGVYDIIVKNMSDTDKIVPCTANIINEDGEKITVDTFKINIDFGETKVRYETVEKVMAAYNRDYFEQFWFNSELGHATYYYSNGIVANMEIYCSMSSEEVISAKQRFNSATDELLKGITIDMPEFEREKIIHDRLAKKVVYDLNAPYAHNAYGALVDGKAVCDGYTKAFQYLLQRVGIQSFMVTGIGNGVKHAWNIVRIDGKYYNVDLTWDDQKSDIIYTYFNITDEEIKSLSHILDKESEDFAPVCTSTDANYFAVYGGKTNAFSADEIGEIIKRNGTRFHIYVTGNVNEFSDSFFNNLSAVGTESNLNDNIADAESRLYDREFIITIIVCGDANRDGVIDIRDFVHMKSIIAGNFAENKASDVDKIGNVSATDLAELKKMLLGIKN